MNNQFPLCAAQPTHHNIPVVFTPTKLMQSHPTSPNSVSSSSESSSDQHSLARRGRRAGNSCEAAPSSTSLCHFASLHWNAPERTQQHETLISNPRKSDAGAPKRLSGESISPINGQCAKEVYEHKQLTVPMNLITKPTYPPPCFGAENLTTQGHQHPAVSVPYTPYPHSITSIPFCLRSATAHNSSVSPPVPANTFPWPSNTDTRATMAALSMAYSSMLQNTQAASQHRLNQSSLQGHQTQPDIPSHDTRCVTDLRPTNNTLARMKPPVGFSCSTPTDMDKLSSAVKPPSTQQQSGVPNGMIEVIADNMDCWQQFQQAAYANNLDPQLLALYGGAGYNFELSGTSRRKNATRETTSMLKAWLNEHRKNPYPTKGEKIMLAIITKMSLTQVSTWFANARRRLKKENKMTWSARNTATDEDSNGEGDTEYDEAREIGGMMSVAKLNEMVGKCGLPAVLARCPITHSSSDHLAKVDFVKGANEMPQFVEDNAASNGEPPTKKSARKPSNHSGVGFNEPQQQRKIWSLVDMAADHMSCETQPHGLINKSYSESNHHKDRETEKPLPQSWMNLLSKVCTDEPVVKPCQQQLNVAGNFASSVVKSCPTPHIPENPLLWAGFLQALNNSSCNLDKPPASAPLLSPATLAAFYLHCQQQQQQQQQLQQQQQRHQRQQQELKDAAGITLAPGIPPALPFPFTYGGGTNSDCGKTSDKRLFGTNTQPAEQRSLSSR